MSNGSKLKHYSSHCAIARRRRCGIGRKSPSSNDVYSVVHGQATYRCFPNNVSTARMTAPEDEDDHRLRHYSPCQTAQLVPAPAFLRPGFASLLHSPQSRVGGAPRDVRVLGGTPGGVHVTRHARRLARRLASHDAGRTPPGAPPWRFWAPGPRFRLGLPASAFASANIRIGYSELLAARS